MSTLLDLLGYSGITPKKVARVMVKEGGSYDEYHSPCPVCGGKDRFHCWPERPSLGNCPLPGMWGCRACDASGDIIGFLKHVEGLGYRPTVWTLRQGRHKEKAEAPRLQSFVFSPVSYQIVIFYMPHADEQYGQQKRLPCYLPGGRAADSRLPCSARTHVDFPSTTHLFLAVRFCSVSVQIRISVFAALRLFQAFLARHRPPV